MTPIKPNQPVASPRRPPLRPLLIEYPRIFRIILSNDRCILALNSTDDFNAAQLKAVCVEAGMLALRRDATDITHEDFVEGITQVQSKKKTNLHYYA